MGCGSRKGYESQLISTTTSIEIAEKYYEKSPAGTRIVKLEKEDVEENVDNIFDLTVEEHRDNLLTNPVFKGYARKSSEVVLKPKKEGIPVTTIKGPKEEN